MATRSRKLTGFNRAVIECLYFLFFILTFLHDEWRRITRYFVTTKQGENFSWFGLRLFFHKFCWKPRQLRPQSRCSVSALSIRWQSYLDLISDIFRYVFDTSCSELSNATFSVPLWSLVQEIIFGENGCLTLCPMAIVNFVCCPFCSTYGFVHLSICK